MKKFMQKAMATFLGLTIALSLSVGFSSSAFAAGPLTENETDNSPITLNNTLDTAKFFAATSVINKSFDSVQGNFWDVSDTSDFYRFSLGVSDGTNGRIAIKLEGVPLGHNYTLRLLDANGNLIQESARTSNTNEIVRTPRITASTTYFVQVIPVTVPDYASSNYRIVMDKNIVSASKSVAFSPVHVTSTNNAWSSDVGVDCRSLPVDAIVTAATVQADQSTTKNSSGHQLHAKLGNGAYSQVAWKTGAINLPGLIGQNASNYWYMGFMATELQVYVGGKYQYLGLVQMDNLKMNITYEYDQYRTY